MRRIVIPLLICAIALPVGAGTSSEVFTYARWLRGDQIRIERSIDGTTGSIWIARDAVDSATFCPQESDFFCFYSSYHAIAIPRDMSFGVESWEHRGVVYTVEQRGIVVRIFGRTLSDLVKIRVPSTATSGLRFTGDTGHFLYSPALGIVGFSYWKDDQTTEATYWLVGEKGFGAVR